MSTRRRFFGPWWSRGSVRLAGGGILATLGVAAVVAVSSVHQAPAMAATPALLVSTPVSTSASELLGTFAESRRGSGQRSSAIRTQTWSLDTTIAADGSIVSSSVEPYWNETTVEPDGTVRVRITAAAPFPGQDAAGFPAPGTVIGEESFAPGTYDQPYPDPVPTDAALVGDYLRQVSGLDTLTGGDAIREIAAILSSVVLTPDQEAALLQFLGSLPGLTVSGDVTDRLGREGIAFLANDRDPGVLEDVLVVSALTGRILAAETVYVGDGRDDITAPAVISYTAWQD